MPYPLCVGDSFTIRDVNGIHLNFIVAESSPESVGMVMLFYLSSSDSAFKDPTTIIKYGEHPFIDSRENESWIKYQSPLLFNRSELQNKISHYYGSVSHALLDRIEAGISQSELCPRNIRRLFKEWNQDRLLRS